MSEGDTSEDKTSGENPSQHPSACGKQPVKQSSCCASASQQSTPIEPEQATRQPSCCPDDQSKPSIDWLLWGSSIGCLMLYLIGFTEVEHAHWLGTMSHTVQELLHLMWWSLLLAIVFVGFLSKVPREFITSILGQGGTPKGLVRATLAGVLLDLCSHGILAVGMELYRKGASLGQVMAFLIASPWNSISLTIILFVLIGWQWTLAFIVLSVVLALTTGWLFDRFERNGILPKNPNTIQTDPDFNFWMETKKGLAGVHWDTSLFKEVLHSGVSGSKMVIKWLFFGILLAAAIRGFVSLENFQNYFGPSMLGLMATLLAATIIEVCSEGSAPIAADIMNRAHAPGNSFTFLMAGVATDYTEIMVTKETTHSWKIALFLPLLTIPQVLVIAIILNGI